LSVVTRFHIGTKQPPNVSAPKKNMVVYLNGFGFAGSAWRPKNQACHGTTVERHGVPWASQICATGFVVSGVEVVTIMSTFFWRIRSWATCEARFGSDCVSAVMICTS
jgi:hypothetical protein